MATRDMKKFLKYLAALFRLSKRYVCSESADLGLVDFHDYQDSDPSEPYHFYTHRCRRCGKEFII